jgi:hypothetical protein
MNPQDRRLAEPEGMFLTYEETKHMAYDPCICRVCGALIALRDQHIDYHARETG